MKKIVIALVFFPALLLADGMSVYFTDPGKGQNSYLLKSLIGYISAAQKTIDLAVFDIDNQQIASSLVKAAGRGVVVRIVTDSDNLDNAAIRQLSAAGIKIVADGRKPFMHNKFAVIDSDFVWTGSYNFTDNCTFKNNNNALAIRSAGLAEIYSEEFQEMFERRIFGNRKEDASSVLSGRNKYYVSVGESDVNVYFSPDNDVEKIIIQRLSKAKKSVLFLAFSFTSKKIAEELIALSRRGVKVSGVYDDSGAGGTGSQLVKLVSSGVDVRIKRGRGVMHDKLFIVDDEQVITGSYNFTKSASEKNDENILFIYDSSVAKMYRGEFMKIYSQSSPVGNSSLKIKKKK